MSPVSTTQLFLIPAFIVFIVTMARYAGWAISWVCAYVMSLGGITTVLYIVSADTVGGDPGAHYGITHAEPTIWLSDILLLGALIAIWREGGRLRITGSLALFLLPSLLLLFGVWGNFPEQWSGLKLYGTAIVAFAVGRWLSSNLTNRAAFALVCACLITCVVQFVIAFAQSRGIMLISLHGEEATRWIEEGRMVGLYNHPGFLGRTMFLLFCFLFPLSTCSEAVTRRLAYIAIALGSVATLLTLSRANTVAIVIALTLWLIFNGQAASFAKKMLILAVGAVLVIINSNAIGALQLRQEQDPNGAYRDPILDIGIEQIKASPLTGTGPNFYSEIVGQYDRFAATGFPLHNSLLYPVAELGIPLAIVLFLPLTGAIASCVSRLLKNRKLDLHAAVLFSILPGILVSAWTGFGLVVTEALPLWYMGFGYLSVKASRYSGRSDGVEQVDNKQTTQRL